MSIVIENYLSKEREKDRDMKKCENFQSMDRQY